MSRACTTCQHLKRPEIDRRLAAGEPTTHVARDYELNLSSLHRHRVNCLKLGSSGAIKKEEARGTAAVALLPSKETLSGAYFELRDRIDQIVARAEQQGSLSVAVSGLNALQARLSTVWRGLPAMIDRRPRRSMSQCKQAMSHRQISEPTQIAERLKARIQRFDQEPDVKARIAQDSHGDG